MKYTLKFNNKNKLNRHPLAKACNKLAPKQLLKTQYASTENQASQFLRHLSETDYQSSCNYKTYSFKPDHVSPWIENTSVCQSISQLREINLNPQDIRFYVPNKKQEEVSKLEKRKILKYQKRQKVNQEKKGIKIEEKKIEVDRKENESKVDEKRWLKGDYTKIKSRILESIEKESLITLYQWKKLKRSKQNNGNPLMSYIKNKKIKQNIIQYNISNPLTRNLFYKGSRLKKT